MKLITVFGRYIVKYDCSWLKFFYAFSANAKSIEEAVQEMIEGNAEAYLGLTDSIVGMIKFFHPYQPGTPEGTAIQKVPCNK